MNIILREWQSYVRQTTYWMIGLFLLLFISFYKMDGLSSTQGGIQTILESLPPALQVFFGSASDMGTGIGIYQMIHLYLAIALSLHAVILGAHIFAKEEHDKTFEFLYVKGVKRIRILCDKIIAGIVILLVLDVVCVLGIYMSIAMMNMTLSFMDLLPYMSALCMMQLFFFSMSLLISLLMKQNQKAGAIGCGIVFVMFMITMYGKMGGNVEVLDKLSLFHYTDASYIQGNDMFSIPTLCIAILILVGCIGSQWIHERRDLL